jgi:endonuclease YncB( thermonuclease family)
MKIIISFLFVISLFNAINGQDKFKFEFEDQCGSPVNESQIYAHRQGKVTKIIDGDTVKIRDEYRKIWTVELAGADSSRNQERTTGILTERLLNQEVLFIGNPETENGNLVEAIVRGNGIEMNRFLVENGHASYRDTDYGYAVSNYTLCVYDKLIDRAKTAKLGIWADK